MAKKAAKKERKQTYKPESGPRQFARVLTDDELNIAVEMKRKLFPDWDIGRRLGCPEECVTDALKQFHKDALLRTAIKVAIEKEDMLAELKHAKRKLWMAIEKFDEEFVSQSSEKGFTANGPVDKETVTRERKVAPASLYDSIARINKQISELLGLDEFKEASADAPRVVIYMPDNKRDQQPPESEEPEA